MANSNEELSRARKPNENSTYIYIYIFIYLFIYLSIYLFIVLCIFVL